MDILIMPGWLQNLQYEVQMMSVKRNLIIAVDFDGTLCHGNWPGVGEPNRKLIDKLLKLQRRGNKIILWTCREGEALCNAVEWCKEFNLIFDAINDNLPEIKEMYGNNSRKISCDIYIDDKSCIPEWE